MRVQRVARRLSKGNNSLKWIALEKLKRLYCLLELHAPLPKCSSGQKVRGRRSVLTEVPSGGCVSWPWWRGK